MSKSIRISDELAAKATKAAELFHRSPPQQIEHWAQIGQVMEAAMSYPAQKAAVQWGSPEDIDALVAESQSPSGQAKLREGIQSGSGGAFWEASPDDPNHPVQRASVEK